MDPFRVCLALGPVAVYVLLLGALNLSRRPFTVTTDATIVHCIITDSMFLARTSPP